MTAVVIATPRAGFATMSSAHHDKSHDPSPGKTLKVDQEGGSNRKCKTYSSSSSSSSSGSSTSSSSCFRLRVDIDIFYTRVTMGMLFKKKLIVSLGTCWSFKRDGKNRLMEGMGAEGGLIAGGVDRAPGGRWAKGALRWEWDGSQPRMAGRPPTQDGASQRRRATETKKRPHPCTHSMACVHFGAACSQLCVASCAAARWLRATFLRERVGGNPDDGGVAFGAVVGRGLWEAGRQPLYERELGPPPIDPCGSRFPCLGTEASGIKF